MLVQIHMLQSVPPGNLNRDNTGQPKKCLFGGVTRGRISSQCLKRNIRRSKTFQEAFGGELATRTKYLPRLVADALAEVQGFPEEDLEGVKKGIAGLFKKEAKAEAAADNESASNDVSTADVTPQLVFFPPPFAGKVAILIDQLRQEEPRAFGKLIGAKQKKGTKEEEKAADQALERLKANAFHAKEAMSVDVALFGRMTTTDLIADVEASCQVAHAISTHMTLTEGDYFTAMDDRQDDFIASQVDRKGAAFLGSGDTVTFFNSAVFYKYFNVDTDALAGALGESGKEAAQKAAVALLEAAATATPSGKQNSFAAHSLPELILVEVSPDKVPLSYANAFLEPVTGGDLMAESARALGAYCESLAAAYSGPDTRRFLLSVGNAAKASVDIQATPARTLAELKDLVREAVAEGATV